MARVWACTLGLVCTGVDAARRVSSKAKQVPHSDGIAIVNGKDATECEWRWQVSLKDNPSLYATPWCGGMLIDPSWVLTAAHCVSEDDHIFLTAGDYSVDEISGKEQVRESAQIIKHPNYVNMKNDFALIRLNQSMDLGECVGTISPAVADVAPGSKCWITGWGTLQSGGNQPTVLQEAEVTIISNEDCVEKYDYEFSDIKPSMLCAQGVAPDGSITDACQGDSGGPLVCETSPGNWTLHGATSWGYGCAGKTYPGVWARVSLAHGWIEEVIAGNTEFQPTSPPGPTCNSFAMISSPDGNGDCVCPPHKYCSAASGGAEYDCPVSEAGGATPLWRWMFKYNCENCQCYSYFR